MIVCACHQLKKMLGAEWVLKQINVEVQAGARIGLVGANGSGKTTLLKCISGVESPDEGDVFVRKQVKIGYLAQIPEFARSLTVKDVLLQSFAELMELEKKIEQLAFEISEHSQDEARLNRLYQRWDQYQQQFADEGGYQIESAIAQVSSGLGIPTTMWDRPFIECSGGEKTKIGLATLLLRKPEILLLDEPTNHLDLPSIEWLEDFLGKYQGAVIVVSHDRYFLDRVVTEIWDLEEGEITVYQSNYSSFVQEKEKRLLAQFQEYQQQERKIKKMKETIKRLKEWANRSNPPNAGLHRQAKSMEKALARIEKVKRPVLERKKMNLQFEMSSRSGKDVIVAEQIGKLAEDRLLFSNVDLVISFGQRCAIVGANGTGKTTLLRIIQGEIEADEGTVRMGTSVKVGYLSQGAFEGDLDRTVIEAFRDEVHVAESDARHLLARFLFHGYAVFQKVKDLSGGERMRLRLAQLMHQDINLLILDEPTNHLDIDSREVLEEAILEFPGTVLMISHDRYFLNRIVDQIYWLEDQRLTRYEGNYDWAKSRREGGK
ncbi:ribosomal protection-like ABC-F family protein [Hazenella coriacea]|uniref:ATPase subunit of ABC transporter with duplicated ATPase domains n=1 Tax=Hazenella coriacea TaxID=1179467 RepID=A0A4R3L5W6_9BACL|nr:ABC-F type ribosomal protection protein [Hazenella coriacea]TCS94792.1 ATPase subunit of ABC transporter with duplicated ATPase domains [Hazenella coriacea]